MTCLAPRCMKILMLAMVSLAAGGIGPQQVMAQPPNPMDPSLTQLGYIPNGGPNNGPFYHNPDPVKTFCNPGLYTAYLAVTDNDGNAVTREIRIQVTGDAPAPKTIGPSRLRAPRRSRS